MLSPPVQPKKARSKSQSPPSSLPPCSLQDVLEFNPNETVVTAFEQQLRKQNGEDTDHLCRRQQDAADTFRGTRNGRSARRQFGRAYSITFGGKYGCNNSVNQTQTSDSSTFARSWGTTQMNLSRRGSLADDILDDSSPPSKATIVGSSMLSLDEEGVQNFYDEQTSSLPVPADLTESFTSSSDSHIRDSSSCNSFTSITGMAPRRRMFTWNGSSGEGFVDKGSSFGSESITNSSSDRAVFGSSDFINLPRRKLSRRGALKRSETLPSESKFFPSQIEAVPFRSTGRVHRSMSMLGSIPQRSHSISSWTNHNESSTNDLTIESTDRWLIENTDPGEFNILNHRSRNNNFLDEDNNGLLIDEIIRDRKKIRARRHSIQGDLYIAPLTQAKDFTKDPTLSWLTSKAKSRPQEEITPLFSESTDPLEAAIFSSQGSNPILSSPSNRSVASSRKRGVCGGTPPSSDIDDWSTTGFPTSLQSNGSLSSRRARSRIFQPAPDAQFPVPPSLQSIHSNTFKSESESENEGHPRNSSQKPDHNMEDTDDDESTANSSPDVSMDSGGDANEFVTERAPCYRDVLHAETVFQNMSSYDDLKFMIKYLRKESGASSRSGILTTCWNVVPPVTWSSQRRSKFFRWGCNHLGFTMRSAGMAVNYLQVSKIKGVEILKTLEEALIGHKRHEQVENPRETGHETLLCNQHSTEECDRKQLCYERETAPSPMESVLKTGRPANENDALLVADMMSLAVNESSRTASTYSGLARLVTIDPSVQEGGRVSASRTSIESHCMDTNSHHFMMHLHGEEDSPKIDHRKGLKPQKLSIDSIHTLGSACSATAMACAMTPFALPSALIPIHNLEFLATPLMNETRGWGSQPIHGKDWGASAKCDESIISGLMRRFEESSVFEGRRDSAGSCLRTSHQFSNALAFDIEASVPFDEDIDSIIDDHQAQHQMLSQYEEKRMMHKRVSALNKRRRMSLWASATQGLISYVPGKKSKFRTGGTSLCISDESFRSSTDLYNCLGDHKDENFFSFKKTPLIETVQEDSLVPGEAVASNEKILSHVLSFLTESDLLSKASGVCVAWADLATEAHVNLMLASIGTHDDVDDNVSEQRVELIKSISRAMERSWTSIHSQFPWACYLAEGGAKRVYKVYNKAVGAEEAVSVMDTHAIESKQTLANELAVSALLSSLARRGICPNFVMTRSVFTCAYRPLDAHWGTEDRKRPKGSNFVKEKQYRPPREPKNPEPGRYQYIRMELVNEGDAEELIKRQPNGVLCARVAQAVLFQIAFALHAAADRFSVKHYDIKLLNIFLQKIEGSRGDVVMRYGLGSHVFALCMPPDNAFVAKLADFGTANINSESNGQPVTIAQFTTIENTPPDFMILGDEAKQGHGHDHFGLGLCMLHLFTGGAPYEEIMEEVKCPSNFKKRLRNVWENDDVEGYRVISSLIHDGVVKDEAGHVVEGEPDETLYDTLYRFLVLFGPPAVQFQQKKCPKVWAAISDSFGIQSLQQKPTGRPNHKKLGSDLAQYKRDCNKFSLRKGSDKSIALARASLQSLRGGMDLLLKLCSFDPSIRATSIEVLNSQFMENLREEVEICSKLYYGPDATLFDYTAFSTQRQKQRKLP